MFIYPVWGTSATGVCKPSCEEWLQDIKGIPLPALSPQSLPPTWNILLVVVATPPAATISFLLHHPLSDGRFTYVAIPELRTRHRNVVLRFTNVITCETPLGYLSFSFI